jgi:hypothetical protein
MLSSVTAIRGGFFVRPAIMTLSLATGRPKFTARSNNFFLVQREKKGLNSISIRVLEMLTLLAKAMLIASCVEQVA